jgi:hypothetical protein
LTPSEVQQLLLDRLGLRVGPETAAYVLRSWQVDAPNIPVIATDARTGIRLTTGLRPSLFVGAPTAEVSNPAP